MFGCISKRADQLFEERFKSANGHTFKKDLAKSVKIVFKDEETARTEPPVDIRRVELAVQKPATEFTEPCLDLLR